METLPPDQILIRGLELWPRVGVPEEERAAPQKLLLDLALSLETRFEAMDDRIEETVDYDSLSRALKAEAASGERRLIETLAADLAAFALEAPRVVSVRITLRKFILPDTEHVAVELHRRRRHASDSVPSRSGA